jgi:hypothetical protein
LKGGSDNHDDIFRSSGLDHEFVDLDVDALIAGLSPDERAVMDTMTERMRADDSSCGRLFGLGKSHKEVS